jgi:hypothetical protein
LLDLADEPLVVGHRMLGAVVDQRPRDGHAWARLVHRRRVRLDPCDLGLGEWVTARLEQHHELPHPAPVGRVGHARRSFVGFERRQGVEVEIGALPVPAHDGGEHGSLLGRSGVAEIDRPEQHLRDGLDHLFVDDSRHARGYLGTRTY